MTSQSSEMDTATPHVRFHLEHDPTTTISAEEVARISGPLSPSREEQKFLESPPGKNQDAVIEIELLEKQQIDGPLRVAMMSLADLQVHTESKFLMSDLKASPGLSADEARARLQRNGPNALTPPKEMSKILKYLLMYTDPFMALLGAAGILCFIAYALDTSQYLNWVVGLVLECAVVLSASFSYITEARAGDAMSAFKKLLPRTANVIRDGKRTSIPAQELVVGDIVYVGTGDQVPADLRILFSNDMKVEKASLTGESLPIPVDVKPLPVSKYEDANNIVFNTTQCMEGECYGVVIATGDRTLIGTIAALVTKVKTELTPVQIEIKHFVTRLASFAFVLGLTFFIISLARGNGSWIKAFINSFIVCMVACIPEGLPLTALACLSVTAQRMAKKNVFIKSLSSVETLGSVTAIASDKTGTLTQNKMTVVNLWVDQLSLTTSTINTSFPIALPSRPNLLKSKDNAGSSFSSGVNEATATYNLLELAALLCNRAKFSDERMLDHNEAVSLERSQLLSQAGMDSSLTMGHMRDVFPTLLAGIEEGTSLRNAISEYTKKQKYSPEDGRNREVIGDATDKALFQFIAQRQSPELVRYHNRIIFEVPFNSRNKYAIIICRPHEIKSTMPQVGKKQSKVVAPPAENDLLTDRRLFMKGAPEVVLSKCSHYLFRGEKIEIDQNFKDSYIEAYQSFGNRGERVLGFAWTDLKSEQYPADMDNQYSVEKNNFPTSGLCFLGLISLVDPPKPTVPGAVKLCRDAGIKVFMVTGDHALTAAAIARQVNIITKPTVDQLAIAQNCTVKEIPESLVDAIVVEGSELLHFNEADWNRVLNKSEVVFARTTPAQKLLIVENLQRLQHTVAVTGDGVNDSPALKKANIGVAMGIMGSDVARDAADVILMDDDFASIVEGVRQGRTIFDNLAKTISYTCSHLVPETVPTLLTLAFDFPAAIPSLAILAIDLGTELAPAISFASEVSESDVMGRPPRNRTDRLIGRRQVGYIGLSGILNTAWTWLGYCLVFKYHNVPLSRLPWSSQDYWSSGSDPFAIAGPSGCSMSQFNDDGSLNDAYTSDCVTIDDSEQVRILGEAQGIFFFLIVSFQVMHILMVKTRSVSVFKHPMLENLVMIYGIIIEICLMFAFLFIPQINWLLVGTPPPAKLFALFLIGWASVFITSEGRKYLGRKFPDSKIMKALAW